MTETWVALDGLFLLACASMYLGTGWSLVLFSFPLSKKLTPETYMLPFIDPVKNATRFFTWMTTAMLIAVIPFGIAEWDTGYVWCAIVYLLATLLATGLTMKFIFPYNHEMESGIPDQERLNLIMGKWMRLNTIRTLLWTVEWLAIALYFFFKVV